MKKEEIKIKLLAKIDLEKELKEVYLGGVSYCRIKDNEFNRGLDKAKEVIKKVLK